jgi:predicted ArsR family transcriptional regulator
MEDTTAALTESERTALEELELFERGASTDDMTTALGISRPASARPLLESLERKGYVRSAGDRWSVTGLRACR